MNKTMTIIAVVLSVITAFLLVNAEESIDGSAPSGYTEISDADTVTYTDATLPSSYIYITSTSVKDGAFAGCSNLEYVILNAVCKTVGDEAFADCMSLVYFESRGATSIGDRCFRNTDCTFSFSSHLTTIGEGIFEYCTGKGPYLTGASVKTIPSQAYKDSAIIFEDLRGVTSIASDAFQGASLTAQIINEGQTTKLSGTKEIVISHAKITKIIHAYDKTAKTRFITFFTGVEGSVLTFTDSNGTESVTATLKTDGYGCTYAFKNSNVTVEGRMSTIHYPAGLGLSDSVRYLGDGTFTLPTPTVAASIFNHWSLSGSTGPISGITEAQFITLGDDIYVEATFNSFTVTYDHSQVSGSSGASGLSPSGTFTFGDSYPTLQDIPGYTFSGWNVGNKFVSGGSKITTYGNHTASSVWNGNDCTISVISLGETIDSVTVQAGDVLDLSSLSATAPSGKKLSGWSLTENGSILVTDPVITSDCSIYAIFVDSDSFTVTYMDGEAVLGQDTCLEGSLFTIAQDNPSCEGKTFQNWRLEGSDHNYYKGDSLNVGSDIVLRAVWAAVSVNLEYVLATTVSETYDWGTEVTIGTESAVKTGYTLTGWARTLAGPAEYQDGSVVTLTEDLRLFPIWSQDGKSTVTLHAYNGTVSSTVVDTGSSYTLPTPMSREQYVFDGWALTANGSPSYVGGDHITVGSDIHLYEVWHQPSSGSNSKSSGSGSSSGSPSGSSSGGSGGSTAPVASKESPFDVSLKMVSDDKTIYSDTATMGTSYDLSKVDVPEKEGYRFLGWSTSRWSTMPSYLPGSEAMFSKDTTLFAVWEKLLTVTYHDGESVTKAYCGTDEKLELKTLSKDGFEFGGWTRYDSSTAVEDPFTVSEDTDLYAKWSVSETPSVSDTEPIDSRDQKYDIVVDGESVVDSNRGTYLSVGIGAVVAAISSVLIMVHLRRN